MAREVDCPECGESMELPGKIDPTRRIRCPECDHRFLPARETKGVKNRTGKPSTGGSPKWLPFAIGGGVLAVVVIVGIVLLFALKGSDPKPVDIAKAPTTKAKAVSKPTVPPRSVPEVAQPKPPAPTPEPEPEPVPEPVRPTEPVSVQSPQRPGLKKPAVMPPRIDVPPLPPIGERPVLVLDPGSHSADTKQIVFFPDGKRFATFSEDKSIRIWDVDTGLTVKTIHMPNGPGAEGSLRAGAISPDGKLIAAGGQSLDGEKSGETVYLISTETGEVVRSYIGHGDNVSCLSFSHDGRQIVSSSFDGKCHIHEAATGKRLGQLVGHKDRVRKARFHPRENRIATSSKDGTARIWTLAKTGVTHVELKGHDGNVQDVVWSHDGTMVATAGGDGTIRTWTAAGEPVKTYPERVYTVGPQTAHLQMVTIAFTRDDKEIIFGGVAVRGHAGVLNLESGEHRVALTEHTNTVMACAMTPREDLAVSSGGDNNEMFLWRPSDGTIVQKIVGSGRTVWAVGGAADGTVVIGNVNSGEALPLSRPLEFAFDFERLDFVPKPKQIVTAQARLSDYAIRRVGFRAIEITKNGKPHDTYRIPEEVTDFIQSATLVVRDRILIGTAARMYLYDIAQKKVVQTFLGHAGMVTSVAPCPDNGLFISGCSDQTLRIWKEDRSEPVLSLFVAGREWIAWTPEGYYAASPGGERLMGWQVNNGHLKVGTYYSAIQFRQSLYQPDVIRYLGMAKGDLGLALALAAQGKNKPLLTVNLPQVLPPDVLITSPKVVNGEFQSQNETIEVTATARGIGKNPVKAMRLLVDGRPYEGVKGIVTLPNPKPGEVNAKWKVKLAPGKHTLIVQADAGVSKGLSSEVEIVQAGDTKSLPNLFVFAVGVNEYAGKLKLNYATSDAKSMAGVLSTKTKGVFEKVEVKLLTDKQATKDEILLGLDWLESKMTAKDIGIFYFSGHGARDDDGTFYLVPVDINPRSLAKSCVPGDAVKDKLSGMPGRMMAVFDACHSGAAAESLQTGGAGELVRELLTDDCGVVVLCSSMGDEYSLESGSTKAGFFTYSLVEGLNGKADLNKDGYIHIHEATAYAAFRVKELSQGQQNPTIGRSPHLKPFALTKR